jgi:NAD(P) transhydrogenase subunit alpha
MSAEYQAKQAALVSEHLAKQDIVITTALIPGRAAPTLVSEAQAKSMRPGSVISDLAVAQGGNCPLSKPDEVADVGGVKVMGFTNLPARLPADASSLYANNILALLPLLADKESKAFSPAWDDEIIQGAMLTKGGAAAHPHFAEKKVGAA